MINGEQVNLDSKFLAVGTSEIRQWAGSSATPYVIPMNTEKDFIEYGFPYKEFADMKIGEVRRSEDYEGVMVIRIF